MARRSTQLCLVDLSSNVPPPLEQACSSQGWYKLCLVDLSSDIPLSRHLVAKSGMKFHLVDLSSDVPTGRGI